MPAQHKKDYLSLEREMHDRFLGFIEPQVFLAEFLPDNIVPCPDDVKRRWELVAAGQSGPHNCSDFVSSFVCSCFLF